MLTIVDYGIGNLRSIEKAFEKVGVAVVRTDEPDAIAKAERLVLPGVGAFGACINEIRERELEAPILDVIDAGKPFLGVCVGLQLLFEVGEERGTHEGLGVLPGRIVHFHANGRNDAIKVPHMGWNTLRPTREVPLLDGIDEGAHVYFVHSFHAAPDEGRDVLATTTYGHDFPAMVHRNNVFGVQFHPEKSQGVGLRILKNFAQL